ncbi:hypothetical protein JCM14076_26860 [Methylosoma difficile]
MLKFIPILIVLVALSIYKLDPYNAKLPSTSPDLSSVEDQLARLSTEDRKQVEAYAKRSNGQFLPPNMADPDAPFTARTFGEAIKLEQEWQKKMVADQAKTDALKAQRQARLDPLLNTLNINLIKADIVGKDEYAALYYHQPYQETATSDKTPVFVVYLLLQNLSDETISEFTGSIHANDKESPLPMNICWLEHKEELSPNSEKEIVCGSTRISAEQQAFLTDNGERFEVVWEPHHIKLASGRELDSGL